MTDADHADQARDPADGPLSAAVPPGISSAAARAVEDLYQRRSVESAPEGDPDWNEAFVGAIRSLKERFRGSPDLRPLLSIASEQLYGRDIHWALELIQNAEDAGARRIVFVFERDRVLVQNDGETFNAADVWAICSAGHSTKKNKIGFFGIGFKSVFKLTDAPEIRSGPYAFRIEEKIYPEPLRLERRRRGARFTLPVRPSELGRLASIVEQLTGPEFLHLLLTLDSLESIVIVDRITGRGRGRFYRRPGVTNASRGWDECRIGGSWPGCDEQAWRRYRYTSSTIPAGIVRQGREVEAGDTSKIVLARPTDRPIGPTKLHCFLPLDVSSELRWLVQADFDPTPGRERLRENDWNRWLLSEVGQAIAKAIEAEARSGQTPWPLIPLGSEVTPGSLQRRAFDAAMTELRDRRFVRTTAGWRTPANAVWPPDDTFRDVVREADLAAATGLPVSYVAAASAPLSASPDERRMHSSLTALGGRPVRISDLLALLRLDDHRFGRRDGRWWLRALHLVATQATPDERDAVATTACIPIEGGGRIWPSPRIALTGYLVGYSRSATLTDLRRYFTESEIHLVDPFLDPTPGVLAARRRGGDRSDMRAQVREMLAQEPFRVALEAGPYHVVTDLIVPRMAALAQLDHLDDGQREQLFRMVEFIRHRWRGFVNDYRRARRTQDEGVIARQLGDSLRIVARVGQGRTRRLVARPLTSTYLNAAMLGHDGMDIVLAGKPDLAIVDDIHARTIPVPRGRGIQRGARAQMPPVEFLRFLGGLVGPHVRVRSGDAFGNGRVVTGIGRAEMPWIKWPRSASGRPAGIVDDWVSDDVSWLVEQWPSMSARQHERRARALWTVLEADWDRLGPTIRATPAHFYYTWVADPPQVVTSWVGLLGSIAWVGALNRSLQRPRDLVRGTPATKLALASDSGSILGWPSQRNAMLDGIGIAERPAPDRLIMTLQRLRDFQPEISDDQRRRAALACYELLATEISFMTETTSAELVRTLLRPKFQGNGRVGLIFAPPPGGLAGKAWWPPARTVRADVSSIAGPFVGQLAGRYPRSAALWEALTVRADLDPQVIADAIAHELAPGPLDDVARQFYGELVVRLESMVADGTAGPGEVPALTDQGWVPAEQAWWTTRPEIRAALHSHVAWWSPGTYDASIVTKAARWLAVRELTTGEVLQERWSVIAGEELRPDLRERWLAALRAWPELLRSEGGWDRPAIASLAEAATGLQPATALSIEGQLVLRLDDGPGVEVLSTPHVVLRDGVLIGLDSADLFGHAAADTLGSLVNHRQLAASSALAALLGDALRSPEAFAKRIERYSTASGMLQVETGFAGTDVDQEDPDAVEAAIEAIRQASPPATASTRTTEEPKRSSRPERKFADPSSFELLSIERTESDATASSSVSDPKRTTRRRKPRPESHRPERRPDDATPIPPNTAVEDAARPYIEMFELKRGGFVVHRQGPLVGADFVADDGRYIELKASGGVAENAFNLEPSEWGAALDPKTGADYWVYIVEHLTDGGVPEVTAVFNPVRDPLLRQAPVGKMKVSGWRSASKRDHGAFGRRPSGGVDDDPE